MKRFLYRMALSYLLSLNLFLILVPLKLGGLYRGFLFYPAQGEDQMGKNFTRLFFVLPPVLIAISILIGFSVDAWVARKGTAAKSALIRRCMILGGVALLAILNVWVLMSDKDSMQVLALMPALYFAYVLAAGMAAAAVRRLFPRSS